MPEFNDEEEAVEEGAAAGGRKKGLFSRVPSVFIRILKWVLIILVLVSMMILVSFIVSKSVNSTEKATKFGRHEAVSKNMAVKPPILSWFDQIEVIRTQTADVNPYMVMVKVSIGFDREDFETQTELIDRQIPIQDTIRSYFARKRQSELQNEELIKRELKDQLNQLLNTERIKDIAFKEFSVISM